MKRTLKVKLECIFDQKTQPDVGVSNVSQEIETDTTDPTTAEDNEKDESFVVNFREIKNYLIVPFRLLSATIVSGLGYPIDYTKPGLLQKSVDLFAPRTVFLDHNLSVRQWVGLVKNAKWNESTDPPGIDAELWIDKRKKDADDLILGIKTGAINRCSVTIEFEWEKSHKDMNDHTFWDTLGEKVEGKTVRIIVTQIIQIYETSLVWWGADDTAKTLKTFQNTQNTNPNKEENNMDRAKLRADLAKYGITLPSTIDDDSAGALEQLFSKCMDLEVENTRTKSFRETVMKNMKDKVLTAKAAAAGVKIEEIDQFEKDVIDQASYEKLVEYAEKFQKEKTEKFPATCQHCGRPVKQVRSSVDLDVPDDFSNADTDGGDGGGQGNDDGFANLGFMKGYGG